MFEMIIFVDCRANNPKTTVTHHVEQTTAEFPKTIVPEDTYAKIDDVAIHNGVPTASTKEDDDMKHPELHTGATSRNDRADDDVEGQEQQWPRITKPRQ